MRTIDKSPEGYHHLNNPHANPPANAAQAESRWRAFGYKQELSDLLKSEQYYPFYTAARQRFGHLGEQLLNSVN